MSETPKHSPGPWKTCGAHNDTCKCGLIWSTPEDRTVAIVQRKDDTGECSEETFHANAALIASAPGLAAQLAALTSRLEQGEALLRAFSEGKLGHLGYADEETCSCTRCRARRHLASTPPVAPSTGGRAHKLRLKLFEMRDAREVTSAAGFKLTTEAKAKLYDIQQDIVRAAIAADDLALNPPPPSSEESPGRCGGTGYIGKKCAPCAGTGGYGGRGAGTTCRFCGGTGRLLPGDVPERDGEPCPGCADCRPPTGVTDPGPTGARVTVGPTPTTGGDLGDPTTEAALQAVLDEAEERRRRVEHQIMKAAGISPCPNRSSKEYVHGDQCDAIAAVLASPRGPESGGAVGGVPS